MACGKAEPASGANLRTQSLGVIARRHWEERNRVQWSRERLAALLTPMPATGLDAALGAATIVQLKNLTGEVTGALCRCGAVRIA